MEQELWKYQELASYIGKSTEATRQLVSRERKSKTGAVPLPTGKIGRSPYWLSDSVIAFYSKKGGERRGGRPRNPPVV